MATNPLTYSIQNDFAGEFSPSNFSAEIRDPSNGVTRALSFVSTEGDTITVQFVGTDDISSSDLTIIQGSNYPSPIGGLVASHDPEEVPGVEPTAPVKLDATEHQQTPEGLLVVSPLKSFETPSIAYCSPNYADKTTWWLGSEAVVDEAAVDSGDGLTWNLASTNLVSIYGLTDGTVQTHFYNPANYRVAVKRNGTDISADQYGYEGGCTASGKTYPYQVNYKEGRIVFDASQAGHTILVSYSKGLYGRFRLLAPAGYRLCLEHVELQFTADHGTWQSPMEFVAIRDNPQGGPQLEIVVGTYRNMFDILNKFNPGSECPPTGEFTKSIYQLPYNYPSGYTIVPSGTPITKSNTMHGLELRMKYPTVAFDPKCEVATATFYCFLKAL